MVKAAYTKKRREAERIGDEATAARVCHLHPFSISFGDLSISIGINLGIISEVHQKVISSD